MSERELKIDVKSLPASLRLEVDVENRKVKDYISGDWVEGTPEEIEAVQVLVRRLVDDYGYPKTKIQTHPQFRVRKRPSDEEKEYPVDIAVFTDSVKTEDNLYMIGECKQPDINAGLRQLKIYLDLSTARLGIWFNGKEHAYILKTQKLDGSIDYSRITSIPKYGQRIEDIGLYKRKDLMPTRNLQPLFKDIRNHLSQSAAGITRDEKIAQEVINILFCKIYDEVNTGPEETVTFRSGVNEPADTVAGRMRSLFGRVKIEYYDIFNENDRIELDSESINYVVGELQNFCITKAERDVLGDAFEVFIGPALRGSQGQFFTPRNVVKLAVSLLDPNPDDLIIDPACGSGGFLVVVLDYIWKKIKIEASSRGFTEGQIVEKQKAIANKAIRGIDKDNFLSKVTKAYMAIIGDGRGGVFCENTLEPQVKWQQKTRDRITFNSFSVLLTNPPFGAKIPVKETVILEQFDLGYQHKKRGGAWIKTSTVQKKQPPQILFIERCLDLLSPKGKMAIVLPDGVLGGSRVGYVARFILEKTRVIALIDLPKETFQPSVSTKTHLVVLEKLGDDSGESDPAYNVFMAIAKEVGHDRKNRPLVVYNSDGSSSIKDDLPRIADSFNVYKDSDRSDETALPKGYLVSSKWLENYLVAKRYLPKYISALEELKALSRGGRFELKTLKEIKRQLFTGANIGAEDYVVYSDYRYVMTDCITEFGINPSKFKYVSEASYRSNLTKVVREGDLLINRTGKPGITNYFPSDMAGVLACGFTFVLRVKNAYNSYYVAAFLNSRLGLLQTQRLAFGSILEHITKDDLENVLIAFPTDPTILNGVAECYRNVVETQMNARLGILKFFRDFEETTQLK